MNHYPITNRGAAILREAVGLVVRHVVADGGDKKSTQAGPWVQTPSWDRGNSYSGKVAQAYAAAHGTPLTDYHPTYFPKGPQRVLAVDFSGRITRGYGDIAAHIAVMGGWKMVVDARDARPDIDLHNLVVGTPFLGAVRDPHAQTIGLPTVRDAATVALTDDYKPQRYGGDPCSPTMIDCDECPFERDYGYGAFARHDLYASRNTVAHLIHIADLILTRDGWAPTGVSAPRRSQDW